MEDLHFFLIVHYYRLYKYKGDSPTIISTSPITAANIIDFLHTYRHIYVNMVTFLKNVNGIILSIPFIYITNIFSYIFFFLTVP